MDYTAKYRSPLGEITLACDGRALTGLWFAGQAHAGFSLDAMHMEAPHPILAQTAVLLDRYFSGDIPRTRPPMHLRGTLFQRAVWTLLQTIPVGETVTYGDLADCLAGAQPAARMSPQAVGNALARNPILILIPCHRVIAADGSMSGYAAGPERKRLLLMHERGGDITPYTHIFSDSGQNAP